jgi:hypothetical protein
MICSAQNDEASKMIRDDPLCLIGDSTRLLLRGDTFALNYALSDLVLLQVVTVSKVSRFSASVSTYTHYGLAETCFGFVQ